MDPLGRAPAGHRRSNARRHALAALLAPSLLALAACSGTGQESVATQRPAAESPEADRPEAARLDVESYVALGDSFTAAPYVPATSLAGGCFRSDGNYPSLVAAELGAELHDVSCSGADTADLTAQQSVAGGRGSAPPQVDAVRRDTDLVTVGIGGNDRDLFGTLIIRCTLAGAGSGSPCADELTAEYGATGPVVEAIGQSVVGALEAVRTAAPDAEVVLVGYPRMVSADRACRAMPLAAGDRVWLAGVETQLNRVLRSSARKAGARFADLHRASSGHEICSADPWVNGRQTDQSRALAFHPFAEGQEAVADAVLALLADGS